MAKLRPERLEARARSAAHGNVLGLYYQDFSAAIALVESGYHGVRDDRGIPLVRYGRQGFHYNPITAAQYGLANLDAVMLGDDSRRTLAEEILEWLVGTLERQAGGAGLWRMPFRDLKYPWLDRGWVSALALGQGISALLRGHELFGRQEYLVAAGQAYEGLHAGLVSPPLVREESGGAIWYEEYPADPPLHVLNGHIYALLGVLDWARVTGDPQARRRWEAAVSAVRSSLASFDTGYWSLYDLRFRELSSLHYHKNIHLPQLEILGILSGDPCFDEVARRWRRYLGNPRCRIKRWLMLRLAHRVGRTTGEGGSPGTLGIGAGR